MAGHVCADVRDMCPHCESRAIDAYERVDEYEPSGWDRD